MVVRIEGAYFAYNTSENLVGENAFDGLIAFEKNDTLFIGRAANKYYVLNAAEQKMSLVYDEVYESGSQFITFKNGKYGLMNYQLKETQVNAYSEIQMILMGDVQFYRMNSDRLGLSDGFGKAILDIVYDIVNPIDNLIAVKSSKKMGFINRQVQQINGLEGLKIFSKTNIDGWINCVFESKSALLHVLTEKIIPIPENTIYAIGINLENVSPHFVVRNKKYV